MAEEDRMIHTPDELQYMFRLTPSTTFEFEVRCPNDAHLCFTDSPTDESPIVEVFLGGWGNTKSAIRLDKGDNVAEAETDAIMTGDEFKKFWVKFKDGNFQVGMDGEEQPFMNWQHPEPFIVSHVGFCTGWGAEGDWKFQDPRKYKKPGSWVDMSEGADFPKHAVVGADEDGETYYVARSYHHGDLIPGKASPDQGVCKVSYGGEEHEKAYYQVLVQSHPAQLDWLPAHGGNVPTGAIQGGVTAGGEPLFVGRSDPDGVQGVGKVHPSHGGCFVPRGGAELSSTSYEVLCVRQMLLK